MKKQLDIWRALAVGCMMGMAFMIYLARSHHMTLAGVPDFYPSSPVIVPSTVGPVKIILECSGDDENWIPADPGTYDVSTTNRFFRVRAVPSAVAVHWPISRLPDSGFEYDPELVKSNGTYWLFCIEPGSDIVFFTNARPFTDVFTYVHP